MDFQKLVALFISDPPKAIEECQNIIVSVSQFDSYKDFYSYHLKNAHMSTCQEEWSESQLCVYCSDCAVLSESCICLPCFLNGNHVGHNYIIQKTHGNCDCGDLIHWKKSGFCSKHHGIADNECPENYIDEKLRTTLTDVIFKAAFTSLKEFTNDHTEKATQILQFVSSFLKFGDGFRRLISISLKERFDLNDLMQGIINYDLSFNTSLQQLCGGLINDQLFLRNFSKISYDLIENKIVKDSITIMNKGDESVSYRVWDRFWFHGLSTHCFQYNIEKFNWDWVKFAVNTLPYMKEIFKFINKSFGDFPTLLKTIAGRVKKATDLQPNEETQRFFDELSNKIISCGSIGSDENDSIYFTSFKEFSERLAYFSLFNFEVYFYSMINAFKNKANLKLDSLFDQLEKLVNISPIYLIGMNSIGSKKGIENENDKFVAHLLNQKENLESNDANYKSFHNGATFFLSHPTVETLASLFRIDELCRIKIASFLSLKKFQNLRIRLGITVLKSILSFICFRQSIASPINNGLNFYYTVISKSEFTSYGYIKYVPLFQLLLGLQGNENSSNDEFGLKEFFSFELARELGIFDDFDGDDYKDENVSEKQKQMFFTFLYMSLLFVTERKLYHFDGIEFIREQIIFSLKKGIHSIDQIDQNNDYSPISEQGTKDIIFNDILMKVADTLKKSKTTQNNEEEEDQNDPFKSNNQETMFYLKENIEYNYISAINSINEQMTIMNNQILKEPTKLLPIPSFESEETFFFKEKNDLKIHLKQFLFTPTVLAIVYHSLRNPSQSSELNEHLAMNILILISKFISENDENQQSSPLFNESTEIHYDDLVDFITKLKVNVFNYHLENEQKAVIENTLNKDRFISLLKMKISSTELQPKSFIEVLLEKGKLGHFVLHQISNYVHIDLLPKEENQNESSEQDIKAEKRKKANKLKADILNQFRDKISNFNQRGSDSIDAISSVSNSVSLGAEREVCSICSTYKNNEVFAYPLYLYRTKLPFIIDKPPKFSKDFEGNAIDDITSDYEKEYFKNEGEGGKEEEEDKNDDSSIDEDIDREQLMAAILGSFPNLENTEGMNEEQLNRRNEFINTILESLRESIIEDRRRSKSTKKYGKVFQNYLKEEHQKYLKSMETKSFKRCTIGAEFVLQFSLCQHSVHPNCVKEIPFICPIDRSRKNCLLPALDSIPMSEIFKDLDTFELKEENEDEKTLSNSIINSIKSFRLSFISFFEIYGNILQATFIELIKSISALISTYEIRLRSLPDCLDSEKNFLLARNLFLTTWYLYRIYEKPQIASEEEEKRMTLFQRLIKNLIESDEIEKNIDNKLQIFKGIVTEFIDKNEKNYQDEKYICLFLRRCCLVQHFLLNIDVSLDSISSIIDWDELFAPSNLSLLYNVKFNTIDVNKDEEFEFKTFTFLNLPKEFIRLLMPPFNLPIEKSERTNLFNMLDYNYLINHYDEISGEIINDDHDVEEKKNLSNLFSCENDSMRQFLDTFFAPKLSPSFFLFIGKYASNAIVVCDSLVGVLPTFYLDKYGCTDIDFKRSQPLFLNEEKFEKCVDMILSGDFANTFISNSD